MYPVILPVSVCTGSVDKCSRAEILSQIESDEHDTSDEDQNGVLLVIYDIKYVFANIIIFSHNHGDSFYYFMIMM